MSSTIECIAKQILCVAQARAQVERCELMFTKRMALAPMDAATEAKYFQELDEGVAALKAAADRLSVV